MRGLAGFLAAALIPVAALGAEPLPALKLDPSSLTVSGVSSGGYMAVQYHVAYSGKVAGAGIVSAGPWYCAQASIARALGECMKGEDPAPATATLVATARKAAADGRIDALDGLAADRVWVFHGSKDTTVRQPVTDSLVEFYRAFIPAGQVRYETGVAAAHGFPTLDEGIGCDTASEPWLNDCDYDAAGALLAQLYGPLKPRGKAQDGHLRAFEQHRYADSGTLSSLEPLGYVYVPKRCERGTNCRIHVAFHGCRQGTSSVGKAFVKNAGYNEWAETNDIVVLYPQAAKSLLMPLNPQGCWDWWGYTGPGYATRDGPQLVTVRRMLEALGLRQEMGTFPISSSKQGG
jgi:poly(3-hydroxybutyrate) depolymerase